MASSADLQTKFEEFKEGKKNLNTKSCTHWFKDAGLFAKGLKSNDVDIAFSAVKTRGQNEITLEQLKELIKKVAGTYQKAMKLDSQDAAVQQITDKLANAQRVVKGTAQSKTGGVDRMTDASKYTGAHKERFNADGTGKGLEGRTDTVNNTGYVGNYKGEGTYDKK